MPNDATQSAVDGFLDLLIDSYFDEKAQAQATAVDALLTGDHGRHVHVSVEAVESLGIPFPEPLDTVEVPAMVSAVELPDQEPERHIPWALMPYDAEDDLNEESQYVPEHGADYEIPGPLYSRAPTSQQIAREFRSDEVERSLADPVVRKFLMDRRQAHASLTAEQKKEAKLVMGTPIRMPDASELPPLCEIEIAVILRMSEKSNGGPALVPALINRSVSKSQIRRGMVLYIRDNLTNYKTLHARFRRQRIDDIKFLRNLLSIKTGSAMRTAYPELAKAINDEMGIPTITPAMVQAWEQQRNEAIRQRKAARAQA